MQQKLIDISGTLRIERAAKTAAGRRGVALPAITITALNLHKTTQHEVRLALGEGWHDNDLIFDNGCGKPRRPSTVYRRLVRLVKQAGLPHLSPHGLRHTHATLLFVQGVHPKLVSERLGHAGVGITLNTYTHVIPTMHQQAADAIERAIVQQA